MQLKVIKADTTEEQYLHTKVMATLMHAFSGANGCGSFVAEQLADSVTFYLYNKYDRSVISSSQILSIIKASLDSTGYGSAAEVLEENHYYRSLLRSRIEVVDIHIENLADAAELDRFRKSGVRCAWNKSVVVNHLINKYQVDSLFARAVASMVEEKILNLSLRCIPTSLIKYLVLTDAAAMMQARQQLSRTTGQSKLCRQKKQKRRHRSLSQASEAKKPRTVEV